MRKDDALSRATGRGGSPEGIAEESAKGKVRQVGIKGMNNDWLVVWNIFIFPYIGDNHPN